MSKKTIVISAVNLNVGGTLTILRECLAYLSILAQEGEYRVVAIVFQKSLANYPHIEYIETQWPKKRWINRLWYEYVSLGKIAQQIGPVYLWLSLHDTSPHVSAERQAVYCHNPFPFYKWKWREVIFAPKIVLFALFSKWIYQKNIRANDYVIVQQAWIRSAFQQLFSLPKERIIVALPDKPQIASGLLENKETDVYQFIFAASPNSHKNFECLTQATQLLENAGVTGFCVCITVKGDENAYAGWLKKNWGNLKNLSFIGFQDRQSLFDYYGSSDCLVFPSKVETWGLPITEFSAFKKPMLLADLPYAHETAAGCTEVAFFDPDKPEKLAEMMQRLIMKDGTVLHHVGENILSEPFAVNWKITFALLLQKNNSLR